MRLWNARWSIMYTVCVHSTKRCRGWCGAKIDARAYCTCCKMRRRACSAENGAVNAFVVRARSLIFAPRYFLLRTRRYTYRTRQPLRSDVNLSTRCASPSVGRLCDRNVFHGEVASTGILGHANRLMIHISNSIWIDRLSNWSVKNSSYKLEIAIVSTFKRDPN